MAPKNSMMVPDSGSDTVQLYKALVEAGVPRSQIIRAYAGKTEPEP